MKYEIVNLCKRGGGSLEAPQTRHSFRSFIVRPTTHNLLAKKSSGHVLQCSGGAHATELE